MIVIVRLDLDRYDLLMIARLYRDGLITMSEVTESKAYREMSELHRLMWERQVMELKKVG